MWVATLAISPPCIRALHYGYEWAVVNFYTVLTVDTNSGNGAGWGKRDSGRVIRKWSDSAGSTTIDKEDAWLKLRWKRGKS